MRFEEARVRVSILENEMRIMQHREGKLTVQVSKSIAGGAEVVRLQQEVEELKTERARLTQENAALKASQRAMEETMHVIRESYTSDAVILAHPLMSQMANDLSQAREDTRLALSSAAVWEREHGVAAAEAASLSAELASLRDEMARGLDDAEVGVMSLKRVLAELTTLRDARAADQATIASLREELEATRLGRSDAEESAAALAAAAARLEPRLRAAEEAHSALLADRTVARLRAQERVSEVQSEARALRQEVLALRREIVEAHGEMRSVLEALVPALGKEVGALAAAMDQSRVMDSYRREINERRALHEQLQELRGNIRVYARVRPMSPSELAADVPGYAGGPAVRVTGRNALTVHNYITKRHSSFQFNGVFGPEASNEDVFEDARPLMTSVLDGYHVCLIAYGPTGTGKTHTMEGTARDPGVNHRALAELFRLIEERRGDWDYRVRVSMVEVYNDELSDLLEARDGASRRLDIRHTSQASATAKHVIVTGLTSVVAKSAADVARVMKIGYAGR